MRVAVVSDFFLDFIGGAQSSIHEQRAALEAAGHEVFVVSLVRAPLEPGSRDLGLTPAFVVPGVDLPLVFNRPGLVARLSGYFTRHRIDLVHVQTEFGLAHGATTAATELGIPVVHTVHTFYWQSDGIVPTLVAPALKATLERATGVRFPRHRLSPRPSDNALRNMTLAMAARAQVVVSPSEHQARDLAAAGITVPIEVVPNPIARSPLEPQPLTGEQAANPRILWVARCDPVKRPLVFAEAVISALARTGNAFDVDFVGDGPDLPALRALTDGHSNIHLHGSLPHADVIRLIDESALVALTSYGFDNQPMTIAESVSRYRGVLFCDPKLREGLGDSGYLAATHDAAGLADAVEHLVGAPELLLGLSAGARTDAATFSASRYVERILGVYGQAARLVAR